MKTKTIYHLNYDCDKIVKIEVRQKSKKKKKRPVVNIERLVGTLIVKGDQSQIKEDIIEACKENMDLLKNEHPKGKIQRFDVSSISLDLTLKGSHKIPLQQAEMFVKESLNRFLEHISKGSAGHAEFVDFCESKHVNKNISLSLGKPIYETSQSRDGTL